MKTLRVTLIGLIGMLLFSCSEESTPETAQTQEEKTAIYDAFVNDLRALEDFEGNPVPEFRTYAEKNATVIEELHKSNAEACFEKAKLFKNVFVVLDDHTVVRIVDHDDCTPSGSWGVCVPLGEGFIRKSGKLNYKNDYLNNIVGRPDHGEQIIYFFNK